LNYIIDIIKKTGTANPRHAIFPVEQGVGARTAEDAWQQAEPEPEPDA
jgi:hypothetical protein